MVTIMVRITITIDKWVTPFSLMCGLVVDSFILWAKRIVLHLLYNFIMHLLHNLIIHLLYIFYINFEKKKMHHVDVQRITSEKSV